MGNRENNIKIFEDTKELYLTENSLVEAIKNTQENTELYINQVKCEKKQFETKAKIIVSKKRSFQAAFDMKSTNKADNICILNFASAKNPGGGVETGSSAQEEALCRCSTLYPCINTNYLFQNFYLPHRKLQGTLYNDDCIYTPNIIMLKSDSAIPERLSKEIWYKYDVITCAAPNLRIPNQITLFSNQYISDDEIYDIHRQKAKKILNIAINHNVDKIILGAFGCGAFQNPPEIVAKAYNDVIQEYLYSFKEIHFAVYCPPNDNTNYIVFKNIIKEN